MNHSKGPSQAEGGRGVKTTCSPPARPPALPCFSSLLLTSADEMFPAKAPEPLDGDAANVAEPQTSLTTPTLGCLRADPSSCQSQRASPLPRALPAPPPPTTNPPLLHGWQRKSDSFWTSSPRTKHVFAARGLKTKWVDPHFFFPYHEVVTQSYCIKIRMLAWFVSCA